MCAYAFVVLGAARSIASEIVGTGLSRDFVFHIDDPPTAENDTKIRVCCFFLSFSLIHEPILLNPSPHPLPAIFHFRFCLCHSFCPARLMHDIVSMCRVSKRFKVTILSPVWVRTIRRSSLVVHQVRLTCMWPRGEGEKGAGVREIADPIHAFSSSSLASEVGSLPVGASKRNSSEFHLVHFTHSGGVCVSLSVSLCL